MTQATGLIAAYIFDGNGGGRSIGWEDIKNWSSDDGILWLHMDYTASKVRDWVLEESGVSNIVSEVLLEEETRPRSVSLKNGLLVTLRGVNMNPSADPEDMVSIRMWIEKDRIISTRHRRLLSIDDIRRKIDSDQGPRTAGEFLVDISECMVERMSDVIESIDDLVDSLEEEVLTAESHKLRPKIASVRRQTISLRRYLAPQREAMGRLYSEKAEFLSDMERLKLREGADRITRYIEDLDSARERAAVTQEELASRLSEKMDARMYLLSIVAAVFLPLGLLTGLLGINVGGIPGADYKGSFLIVCLILLLSGGILYWVFKRRGWMS